jgi:hypothetical protein
MKNENVEIVKKNLSDIDVKKISRKEAIKRTGYMAASAATMMILLSSPSQANGRGRSPVASPSAPAPPPAREPKDDPCAGKQSPWK